MLNQSKYVSEKIKLITAMLIVGTIGIFVENISLPSSVIACFRAIIGTIFLLVIIMTKKVKIHWKTVKKNGIPLILSGVALGFNWILLFEAYRYTTIAVATLCYYMAPVFVIILSWLVLKERVTVPKIFCTGTAVLGATLISGAIGGESQDIRGIGYGLAAAILYCSIILLNKIINGLDSIEKTVCQLGIAAAVMIPYALGTQNISTLMFTGKAVILLFVVGILHTGITYLMFFSAVGQLPAQTTSVLSYIDPITAILLSAIWLGEPLSGLQILGTILIIGSTLANELIHS